MSLRTARISIGGEIAGVLSEDGDEQGDERFTFRYDPEYRGTLPLSHNMPIRSEVYASPVLQEAFNGLIPEGWVQDVAVRKLSYSPHDRMGLLLGVCGSSHGAIEVDLMRSANTTPSHSKTPDLPLPTARLNEHGARGRCLICLERTADAHEVYHPACLKNLFGSSEPFLIDFASTDFPLRVVDNMRHRQTLTGVQLKIVGHFKPDDGKNTSSAETHTTEFILKPAPLHQNSAHAFQTFAHAELLTMRLARRVGIDAAEAALLFTRDLHPVYVTRRFDRTASGDKIHMEDFCQLLARTSGNDKYNGSMEEEVAILDEKLDSAENRQAEKKKLFQLTLFNWCVGNSDNHHRNQAVMLLPKQDGTGFDTRLSPAYDILPARSCVADRDELALAVSGHRRGLRRADWIAFAEVCSVKANTIDELWQKISSEREFILGSLADLPFSDEFRGRFIADLSRCEKALTGS